jgi:hypothetical protein
MVRCLRHSDHNVRHPPSWPTPGDEREPLNVLPQYPNLHVAARTSVKGQNQDIGEIARLLKVRHVLERSVRKAGTRLRRRLPFTAKTWQSASPPAWFATLTTSHHLPGTRPERPIDQ